jgi:cytochrome c5
MLRFWAPLVLAVAAIAATPARLPEGQGRKAVEAACSSCHSLSVVTGQRFSNQGWQAVVNAMVNRGAALTKEQAGVVVEYLAAHFGKDRGQELVEDVCIYCHSLDRLQGHELSREEWRDLIKGMIFEGAPVTDEEFSLILDYLAKNYGKKDPELP